MDKPTVICDTECFVDYWLVMFRRVDTGAVRYYEQFDGQDLDREAVRRILKAYRVVTFNGRKYDLPMITLALSGRTCAQLKEASDRLITSNLQSWQFEKFFRVTIDYSIDHIDLMEVAPGTLISLKQYAGRMHSKRLQDLPVEHSASITPEMRPLVRDYCGRSDLPATLDLWNKLTTGKEDVIAIRERIGKEVGLDLRSKSDAQVAEAVIKVTAERIKGEKIVADMIDSEAVYTYRPPQFLVFRSPELQTMFSEVCTAEFRLSDKLKIVAPKEVDKRVVTIGGTKFQMGIGGLHSMEKSVAHFSDDEYVLIDRDVASFYPMLIKMCGLAPRSMGGVFSRIYASWIDRRIEAKRTGDKTLAQTLKIFLNGIFGKLGSLYSIVFAPNLLIQVTLTGQLVLLMLIERIHGAGIHVVSANTDGIVIRCPRAMRGVLNEIVARWEKDTGLETEETVYRALFSRDVNNYVALKEGGGHKTKGVFTEPSLAKNVENEICNDAAVRFLAHGVPPEHTIERCQDVRKFLTMRYVKGGGRYGETRLGRVVRWYTTANMDLDIRRVTPNKLGNHDKVAGSAGAVPMMELQDGLPPDLDKKFYVNEAWAILESLGVTTEVWQRIFDLHPDWDLFLECT